MNFSLPLAMMPLQVGAQTGKALSSGLQQLLLLIGGGRVALMLPFMAVTFVAFLTQWQRVLGQIM